jgi:sulfopyruvate decarboxylase TPP-binding subunit
MQSSGVGNIINVLGTVQVCRFPLLIIVTMRGEQGEFNPWQVPMGQATPGVLEAMGMRVKRASAAREIAPLVAAALKGEEASAVLISQSVVGIKSFQEQRSQ